MLNLHRLLRDDRLLHALTGLNRKALGKLTPVFAEALAEAPIPRRYPSPRQRAQGAGRKPRLNTVTGKLIYILFYFKCYPTFDLAGMLFDLDRSQASSLGHTDSSARAQTYVCRRLHGTVSRGDSGDAGWHRTPGSERSRNPEKQQQDYSGKQQHTRSHLAAVDPNKRILVLSNAYAGKAHDKGILNQEQ